MFVAKTINKKTQFLAKFYMIEELERCCEKFITSNMNPKKCLMILEKCLMFDISTNLLEYCQNYIQRRINEVLKVWESLDVSHNCLLFLLESAQIRRVDLGSENVREVDLFNFVFIFQ